MLFVENIFTGSGVATTILYISLTAFVGVLIGKIKIFKIKLGVAAVMFCGLIISHFGAKPDADLLHFIREFGLILFVYAIGIDVGPRFFSSFRKNGFKLNLFAIAIVILGFVIAVLFSFIPGISPAIIAGIMSGAVTNTPGLGAAQQILIELGNPDDAAIAGMSYAIAYPFGILGIILTMVLIRVIFRINIKKEVEEINLKYQNDYKKLESVEILITNPNMFNKEISYIKRVVDNELVISRIFREGEFFVPTENCIIKQGDIIYGVSAINLIENLRIKMGDVKIGSKREISGNLAMFNVLLTNRKLAGKTIEQIGIYRRYEANITRIFRAGMELLPTKETTLELGDTVRIVGKRDLLQDIRKELGNSLNELAHPNTIPIFLGIFLGILLGSIPIFIPGLPMPAKLGMAGGPLIIAILLGHKGRIKSFDFYMTPGANMMIKEIGITLFLACVGLNSGSQFLNTLINGGYIWLIFGAAITFLPIFIVSLIARLIKTNYLLICGIISGAMTDPPALEFANGIAPAHAQSTAYATVYPLTMFLRILLAQALILFSF